MSKVKKLLTAADLLSKTDLLLYHLRNTLFLAHELHRYTGTDGQPLLNTTEMVVVGMHLTAERLLGAMPRLTTAFRLLSNAIYGDLCQEHENAPESPVSDADGKKAP